MHIPIKMGTIKRDKQKIAHIEITPIIKNKGNSDIPPLPV
jgi:hypothetical protein